jgi:aryl-alcohol dehydrogenase-like predicted oxidoreductase
MEYTKLGNTGMDVSRICLGCMGFGDAQRWIHQWVLNEENSRPIIKKALDLGINFFDTANVYSIGTSEEILGHALQDFANPDEVVKRVAEIAEKHGVPRVHIALAWLLQKKPVTAPIIGATKITHLEDAVGALSVQLTQEEVAYLEEPYVPHPSVGHQ